MQSLAAQSISKRIKQYIIIPYALPLSLFLCVCFFIDPTCCIILNSSCTKLIQLLDIVKYASDTLIHLVGKHHTFERY